MLFVLLEKESFRIYEETKRKRDLISSSSSRLDSQNSFIQGAMLPYKSRMKDTLTSSMASLSQHLPAHYFKAIRSRTSQNDLSEIAEKAMACSPIVPETGPAPKLVITNPNIQIGSNITLKIPLASKEIDSFL